MLKKWEGERKIERRKEKERERKIKRERAKKEGERYEKEIVRKGERWNWKKWTKGGEIKRAKEKKIDNEKSKRKCPPKYQVNWSAITVHKKDLMVYWRVKGWLALTVSYYITFSIKSFFFFVQSDRFEVHRQELRQMLYSKNKVLCDIFCCYTGRDTQYSKCSI